MAVHVAHFYGGQSSAVLFLGLIGLVLVVFIILFLIPAAYDIGDRVELVLQCLVFILQVSDFLFQFRFRFSVCHMLAPSVWIRDGELPPLGVVLHVLILDFIRPVWIAEAWDWLLRKELGLPTKEPSWPDLFAMMLMTLKSPQVMRNRRPDWLSPFGFFLIPLLSELGGFPAGYNRSNFKYITPFTSDRSKWKTLTGINVCGREFPMAMTPNRKQDRVVPESFRTILRLYCAHPEAKSLAPDGNPCNADTRGLLKRASIEACQIIPVGKETDRRWEDGDDMSMLEFRVLEYDQPGRTAIANQQILDEIAKHGLREMMRRTGLSQHTLEKIFRGQPVRRATLHQVLCGMS